MKVHIIRYSKTAFKPRYQSVHYEFRKDFLRELKRGENSFLHKYYSLGEMKMKAKFIEEHLEDFKYGLWVFIDGYKNNMSLNHLTELVPCWEADIEDNTEVYDVNLEKTMLITDDLVKLYGCFIPSRELNKILNIKRRRKKVDSKIKR